MHRAAHGVVIKKTMAANETAAASRAPSRRTIGTAVPVERDGATSATAAPVDGTEAWRARAINHYRRLRHSTPAMNFPSDDAREARRCSYGRTVDHTQQSSGRAPSDSRGVGAACTAARKICQINDNDGHGLCCNAATKLLLPLTAFYDGHGFPIGRRPRSTRVFVRYRRPHATIVWTGAIGLLWRWYCMYSSLENLLTQ